MKKHNLIIALAAIAITLCSGLKAEAQIFKPSGKTAAELSTKEIVNQAEGDFNKDGVKDLFIATDYGSAFYFGKAGGSYSLFLDTDMPVSSDAKLSVTDKGVLRIQTPQSDVFLFRYQDNSFVLLGGKHGDESYNFLTNKKVETSGLGASRTSETYDMPKHPPFKYGWFPLDWNVLQDVYTQTNEDGGGLNSECMLTFGIYRRMQLEERVDWYMSDPESEKGRDFPCLGEDSSVYGYLEAPCKENIDVTIIFTLLPNGSYKIVSNVTIQNREYEGELYNFLEKHPKYNDLDFGEQLEKAGITVPDEEHNVFTEYFVNGKFIEQ